MQSRRLVILLVATALALMTIDARGFGPVETARRNALSATEPGRDAAGWLVSPVLSAWNGTVHYEQVLEENASLRGQVAELQGRIDELPEADRELEAVLTATDLDYLGETPSLAARVSSDRRTGLERIIEIDRGKSDGVEEGMPILTGEGLVGKIVLVMDNHSVIRLLSDPRFSVGVITRFTGAIGVVTGDGDGRDPLLDLEEGSLDLATDGARFTTSGFDRSRYPGGIPVGTLHVDDDGQRSLDVDADLSHLDYVSILMVEEAE